jgi:alkylhydroperoxidase/carboxymuconolactone decarboxylase family protein YurZ
MSDTPVCDRLRAGGMWNPLWDTFAEQDPAWTERFMAMAAHPVQALEPRIVELIAIAVDASCTHLYAPGVRRHVRRALEIGVTPREILAVLQLVSVLGIHSMSLAAPILAEEIANIEGKEKS